MRPRALLLAAGIALALPGCPDKEQGPYSGPDAELLALVPDEAALLIRLDLKALRRSGVLRRDTKQGAPPDPLRKVDAALLAAGPRPDRGGGPRFALVLQGRLSEQQILAALAAKGHALRTESLRGVTFHGKKLDHAAPRMIFPPKGRQGWLVVVSPSWVPLVIDLIAGRSRSKSVLRHRLHADLSALQGKILPVGWAAARLAPRGAAFLARRVSWPELKRLRKLEGRVVVAGPISSRAPARKGPSSNRRRATRQSDVLELGLTLELDRAGAAEKLCGRLNRLRVPGLGSAAIDCREKGRTSTVAGRVPARALRALLSSVSKPLTRGGRGSTLGGHRGPRAAPAAVKKAP